jgi:hypothetical protein
VADTYAAEEEIEKIERDSSAALWPLTTTPCWLWMWIELPTLVRPGVAAVAIARTNVSPSAASMSATQQNSFALFVEIKEANKVC